MSASSALVPCTFEGHRIRVCSDRHGAAWFVAADVCAVLSIGDIAGTLQALEESERSLHSQEGPGCTDPITLTLISEAALARILRRAGQGKARRLQHWIRQQLLPALQRRALPGESVGEAAEAAPTRTIEALLCIARGITGLSGVEQADVLAAALEDIEANTGLRTSGLQRVLRRPDGPAAAHCPAPPGDPPGHGRLDALQLARVLGCTVNGANQRLEASGLQVRNEYDHWELTEAGLDWGLALPVCARGHRGQRILWDPEVMSLLREES